MVEPKGLDLVLRMVVDERVRQDIKWGNIDTRVNLTNDRWFVILDEEVGETAKALNDKESRERVAEELIQVAAVAVAWSQLLLADDA